MRRLCLIASIFISPSHSHRHSLKWRRWRRGFSLADQFLILSALHHVSPIKLTKPTTSKLYNTNKKMDRDVILVFHYPMGLALFSRDQLAIIEK
jgi:hypothetical protein